MGDEESNQEELATPPFLRTTIRHMSELAAGKTEFTLVSPPETKQFTAGRELLNNQDTVRNLQIES